MDILNLNYSKKEGDTLSADEWNALFRQILLKINSIVSYINEQLSEEVKPESDFYVNGVKQSVSTITLNSGGTYTLNGILYGNIVIDATNPTDDTYLRFNGVTIVSETNNAILYQTPTVQDENTKYKDLIITLEGGSKNFIVCTKQGSTSEDDSACIYSMNNLTVQGVGYLACHNAQSHGIRASKLKLAGPNFYMDCNHDAFHAKHLDVDFGNFYIHKANDIFGTGTEGNIMYYRGNIKYDTIGGKVFDSGVNGYYVSDITNLSSNKMLPIKDYYTDKAPTVTVYPSADALKANSGGSTITPVDGIYTVNDAAAVVSGNLTNCRIVVNVLSVDLYLKDAYINNSQYYPCIYYTPTSKKIAIISTKDTVNVVTSNRNLTSVETLNALMYSEDGNSYDFHIPLEGYNLEEYDSALITKSEQLELSGIITIGYYSEDSNDFTPAENGMIEGVLLPYTLTSDNINIITSLGGTTNTVIQFSPSGITPSSGDADMVHLILTKKNYTTKEVNGVTYNIPTFDADAIKSESNIKVEVKNNSHLYISDKDGDGLDGSDVIITDTSGSLIIEKCGQRGIKGTTTVIGPNCDISKSVITYYDDPENTKYQEMSGVVVVYDNATLLGENENRYSSAVTTDDDTAKATGFSSIYGRNGKASKGAIGMRMNCIEKGAIITDSIDAVVDIDMGKTETNQFSPLYVKKIVADSSKVTNAVPEVSITGWYKYDSTNPSSGAYLN